MAIISLTICPLIGMNCKSSLVPMVPVGTPLRSVETAAQDNQVLRTEDGVGFQPTFAALSRGFIPAGSGAIACRMPHAARLKAAAQDN